MSGLHALILAACVGVCSFGASVHFRRALALERFLREGGQVDPHELGRDMAWYLICMAGIVAAAVPFARPFT